MKGILPLKRSPIPVEPEPTPKKTNPPAKTKTSRMNAHLAWRRRRVKKSVCSIGFGPERPFLRGWAAGVAFAR